MFSRLCKNAIFPLNTTSSSSGGASSAGIELPTRQRSSGTHPPPRPPPLLPRRSRNASGHRRSPPEQTSHFDSSDLLRREPPPPYWVHHHHQLLHNYASSVQPTPGSPESPVAIEVAISPEPTGHQNDSESDNEQQRDPPVIDNNVFCPDLLFTCPTSDAHSSHTEEASCRIGRTCALSQSNLPVTDEVSQQLSHLKLLNQQDGSITQYAPIPNTEQYPTRQSETIPSPEAIAGNVAHSSVEAEVGQPPPQPQDMGQSLSQRRPRLSLTWVLRDQNQQHINQQQNAPTVVTVSTVQTVPERNASLNNIKSAPDPHTLLDKKKLQNKNKNCERLFSEKFANADRAEASSSTSLKPNQPAVTSSGGLMFVCSRTRDVTSCLGYDSDYGEMSGVCGARQTSGSRRSRKSEKVKRAASKLSFRDNLNNNSLAEKSIVCEKMMQSVMQFGGEEEGTNGIKSTYSEPSLSTGGVTEASHSRRHRHRRRRERNRSQRFGYEIKNVDDFLSKCSLSSPGNIPVVLSSSSTLYQTRPGGYQIEIPLPLGMVVNAVFKNQNWLYVQTPHAEEGYVGYSTCLPLGILPQARPTATSKPPPCWESNGDVFPKPCGNMTDSEKEIQMRSGTRSEGARTPKLRQAASNQPKPGAENTPNHVYNNNNHGTSPKLLCGERHLDVLYLRATNQPKIAEKTYAQLKPTTSSVKSYVTKQSSSTAMAVGSNTAVITTQPTGGSIPGTEYGHRIRRSSGEATLPPGTADDYVLLQHRRPLQSIYHATSTSTSMSIVSNKFCGSNGGQTPNRSLLRQTLLAITETFASGSISVQKGDVVTLLACRQVVDPRVKQPVQWFYVRARDGTQGYIPAEVAGHGFL